MQIESEKKIKKPASPSAKSPLWARKINFAFKKSKELDQTENIDKASALFNYADCKNQYWNPESYSFLWGTWLWDQASEDQKIKLNHLYWVAYYSQIISAEIATIYFNQASAVSLYTIPNFRKVCDTLDLESSQERAHIDAFANISHKTEEELFGHRIFSYQLRSPFEKTMLYSDLGKIKKWIRKWQLKAYPVLSSGSPYIGAQYFTIRSLRTLNGKIVQDRLSRMVRKNQPTKVQVHAIPSLISNYHFMDESFHFNTSLVLSKDILEELPRPNKFELFVANLAIKGCQKDHFNFSTAINGIFWFDPALYQSTYKMLRSNIFSMSHQEALNAMEKSFCSESEGMHAAYETHKEAQESYKNYLSNVDQLWAVNKNVSLMAKNNLPHHMNTNKKMFKRFTKANKYK